MGQFSSKAVRDRALSYGRELLERLNAEISGSDGYALWRQEWPAEAVVIHERDYVAGSQIRIKEFQRIDEGTGRLYASVTASPRDTTRLSERKDGRINIDRAVELVVAARRREQQKLAERAARDATREASRGALVELGVLGSRGIGALRLNGEILRAMPAIVRESDGTLAQGVRLEGVITIDTLRALLNHTAVASVSQE